MKLTQSRSLVSLASAALLTVGVGAAVSTDASASSDGHTLKFVAVSGPTTSPTKTTFLGTDVDKQHGKVIGFDTISGRFSLKTQSIRIFVAVSLKGGQLYADLHGGGNTTSFRGRVTGGAGVYKGAEGTVITHSPSQNSHRTYVTVHYHF